MALTTSSAHSHLQEYIPPLAPPVTVTREHEVLPVIHVAMCVYLRVSLLAEVLDANIQAQELDGHAVHLHVCNNAGKDAEVQIRGIVESMDGLDAYTLRTFPTNQGAFARFYMMQDAVRRHPVDYFIVLDDDIRLTWPRSLLHMWAHGRPQEYNSWFGRHFQPLKPSNESTLSYKDLVAGVGKDDKFHYAGTGISVIDVNIVHFYFEFLETVSEDSQVMCNLHETFLISPVFALCSGRTSCSLTTFGSLT